MQSAWQDADAGVGQARFARHCWALFGVAATTFLLLLFRLQATGEEAVYSVEAYEQWYAQDWWRPTFLGGFYQRPPLFTDLIALISSLIGWDHCLAAARLISGLATISSGLALAGFSRRLGATPARAAFSALTYLTLAEPLFYYGWLGYSDALFGALVLASMLAVWLALRERHAGWFALALLCADAAFLTKALTAYVFLGGAGLCCLWHYRAWDCLRRPGFWLSLLLLAVPGLWYTLAPSGQVMAHGMVDDITGKLGSHGASAYLRHLAGYAGSALINLMPAAGLLIWLRGRELPTWLARWRRSPSGSALATQPPRAPSATWPRETPRPQETDLSLAHSGTLAGAIALLNFLPYWLAPQSGVRYLMPLYGLAALWLAGLLWPQERHRELLQRWALFAIALKVFAAGWLFPLYTERVRPDLLSIARQVAAISAGRVLYADTDAWVGISVVALLDTTPTPDGKPRPPLQRPPHAWNDALLISDHANAADAGATRILDFGGVQFYCRGSGCR